MRKKRTKTTKIVWHCSATPPSRPVGSADIATMHKERGWDDIGYHIVVLRDGRVQLGEDLLRMGAHAKGINARSVGVCLSGGVDEDGKSANNFTDVQWASAKKVHAWLELLWPDASHCGHRDLSPDKDGDGRIERHEFMKDCPCFSYKQWKENDLNPVSDLYAPWETGEDLRTDTERLADVLLTATELVADKEEEKSQDVIVESKKDFGFSSKPKKFRKKKK